MREIKFRAWDKATEKHWNPKSEMIYFDIYDVPNFIGNTYVEKHSDEFVQRFDVMQYTGLKDKNGTEIYEGDLMDIQDGGGRVRVKVIGSAFALVEPVSHNNVISDIVPWYIGQIGEVIGNIYENPELLEDD